MKKTIFLILLIVALIICITAFAQNAFKGLWNGGNSATTTESAAGTEASTTASNGARQETAGEATSTAITSYDVSQHASKSDCWAIIEGKVYNATDLLASYSGVEQGILALGCGRDDTELFESWAKANPNDASQLESAMKAYYVGDMLQ
ncbi:MAG TPA: cytochrome b5-like heme/steroid binding domain-containing protein [Candidatus Paceibacterota bacterium]|nr:cytochrome b5-like heme/steroid binding domain-containing protein [Candidatus Paceibacterota bacterium]